MPSIFFTTNPAEYTRVEGVYVSERKPAAAIAGVFLGVVCVVGECVRGPRDQAVEINSAARFAEVFGGRDYGSGGTIIGKIWQSMINKPFGKLLVIRACDDSAVTASKLCAGGSTASTGSILCDTQANHADGDTVTVDDGINPAIIFEFDKAGNGVAGGHVSANISGATTAAQVATILKAAIDVKIAAELLALTSSISTATITLTATTLGTAGNITLSKSGAATVSSSAGTDTDIVRIDASSPGVWGNSIYRTIEDASGGDDNSFDLVVEYLGEKIRYKDLDVHASGVDNTIATLGDDAGNWITITKLANGRPDNATRALISAGTAGTEGSIADTDFTATSRALDVAAVTKSAAGEAAGVVYVAERMSATIKGKLLTLAAASSDRLFLACTDAGNTSDATAETEASDTYNSERIVYCHNWPYYSDPETGVALQCMPTSTLASILSQTDVAINPGDEDAKVYTAGIVKLTKESYSREDYASFRAAGICALEKSDGFGFVSGITSTKTEIADRRSIDFLQLSIAAALKFYVKKPNTTTRRAGMTGSVRSFLSGLKRDERIVEEFDVLTDGAAGNTPTSRGQNIEKLKIKVRLIDHMNFLVLDTEIGTSVQITVAAA